MREKSPRYTYISGMGFVPVEEASERSASADDIRRVSNLLCLSAAGYFICTRFFRLPLTYLAHLLGMNVRINRYTGMITLSQVSDTVIAFFTSVTALLVVFLLAMGVYRSYPFEAHMTRRPYRGVLPLAVPMTVACGVLGLMAGYAAARLLASFGVVAYEEPRAVNRFSPEVLWAFAAALLFGLFQEAVFRGAFLAALRRFGDGFAILASTMLYAAWQGSIVSGVGGFIFGICAAYFVIRSGSVYTALLCRGIVEVLAFLCRITLGQVEQSLAYVIIMVACLLLMAWAVLAYTRYIKMDGNAFRLVRAPGEMSTRMRLSAFCGSLGFILLLLLAAVRISSTVQIIG